MSNVFNLKVSENPSRFEKNEIVTKKDTNDIPIDNKTKIIENIDVDSIGKKTTIIDIYKPAIISLIALSVAIIIYQMYLISKLKKKDKIEEYQESIQKYNVQQQMIENELKLASTANLMLDKEIEAKEKEQKKIALNIIRKNAILSDCLLYTSPSPRDRG